MYKKYKSNGIVNDFAILKIKDKSGNTLSCPLCIPFDEANTDYQEFLQWKADGGVPEEVDNTLTWDDIRATRDQILKDTDWTMTSGATVDQAQWAAYRQVIRDIPQTYKDKTPNDVVWPTQPSTAGPNT